MADLDPRNVYAVHLNNGARYAVKRGSFTPDESQHRIAFRQANTDVLIVTWMDRITAVEIDDA